MNIFVSPIEYEGTIVLISINGRVKSVIYTQLYLPTIKQIVNFNNIS